MTAYRPFQDHLLHTKEVVSDYLQRTIRSRPLNILLAASPGSGKSFLIKQLLAAIGEDGKTNTPFLELNLTSVKSPEDLDVAWNFIQSMNANKMIPTVLFDEADTRIDDKHLYSDFMAPMYDGYVVRRGSRVSIGPAILFYAASSIPTDTQFQEIRKIADKAKGISFRALQKGVRCALRGGGQMPKLAGAPDATKLAALETEINPGEFAKIPALPPEQKLRDFIDRIDHLVVFPRADIKLREPVADPQQSSDAELESDALALGLIRKHFPGAKMAEFGVVKYLSCLIQYGPSRRSAERLIFTATGASASGAFRFENLRLESSLIDQIRKGYEDFNQQKAKYRQEFEATVSNVSDEAFKQSWEARLVSEFELAMKDVDLPYFRIQS